MSIFVIGINDKTAPLEVRELVFFAKDKLPFYLQDLVSREIEDVVLLSTCNRSEIYCRVENLNVIEEWFYARVQEAFSSAQNPIERHKIEPYLYIYQDEKAIAHLMQVACGLDSMVLGEAQILGQMKEAFSESIQASAVGPLFHRLFQQVFAAAKEIRTTTAIGACPVSLVSAASQLGKRHVVEFPKANVVVIGAGEISCLLLRYLHREILTPITLVNRNLEKATNIIETFNGRAFGLHQLMSALISADLVFSATGSGLPLINQAMMDEVMAERNEKPIVMIDIAVPRDIEAKIANRKNVNLFCIDDLKVIVEQNRLGREHASLKAYEMIWQKSRDFIRDLSSFDHVSYTISAYRKQIETLSAAELQIAKHRLHQGMNPETVLDTFVYALTQKLLHSPSVQLRQAGLEGRFELLSFAKQLFAIPEPE